MASTLSARDSAVAPSLAALTRLFFRIGCLSFGGAAAQIAMMHAAVVEEKKWLDDARFRHALSYCMLLPGPEAQQLATYIGWLLQGVKGGLIAGLLFILPGALIMLALSVLFSLGTGTGMIGGLFFGIAAAVLPIILQALIRIGERGLRGGRSLVIAIAAFAAMLFLAIPFPLVIVLAGLAGAVLPSRQVLLLPHPEKRISSSPAPVAHGAALRATFWCLLFWWLPIVLCLLALGAEHRLSEIGLFFSQLSVLSFGGAYAVLAWLSQSAVEQGWLTTAQMMTGLALAETTPGPTILVNQFVGFLAGSTASDPLPKLGGAIAGAAMASWATFAPSFLWIFAGAPYLERSRENPMLASALAGISAAVIGVIAYVALWFALHLLFGTVDRHAYGWLHWFTIDPAEIRLLPAGLAALAALLLFGLKQSVLRTVLISGGIGMALAMAGLVHHVV